MQLEAETEVEAEAIIRYWNGGNTSASRAGPGAWSWWLWEMMLSSNPSYQVPGWPILNKCAFCSTAT